MGFFHGRFQGRFDAAARALDEPPKVAVAMLVYPNTKNFAQPNESANQSAKQAVRCNLGRQRDLEVIEPIQKAGTLNSRHS